MGKLILEAAAPNLTPVRDARGSMMGMNAMNAWDHCQCVVHNHGHGDTVPPGHSVTFTSQGEGLVGAEVTLELGGKSPVIMCHSIARSHTIQENHFMSMHNLMNGLLVPGRWVHDFGSTGGCIFRLFSSSHVFLVQNRSIEGRLS